MSSPRLAYEDPSTPAEMNADCLAVRATLDRPVSPFSYDDLRRELPKREIEIPAAAARLAAALNLQLDGD